MPISAVHGVWQCNGACDVTYEMNLVLGGAFAYWHNCAGGSRWAAESYCAAVSTFTTAKHVSVAGCAEAPALARISHEIALIHCGYRAC